LESEEGKDIETNFKSRKCVPTGLTLVGDQLRPTNSENR